MSNPGRIFFSVLKKELHLYFRGTGFFTVSVVFAIGLYFLFRFTYPTDGLTFNVAVSILWAVHLISSIFSLLASQEWEWEKNALRAIKISGADGYVNFLGKSIAALITLTLLWAVEITAWIFLFGTPHLKIMAPDGFFSSIVWIFLMQVFFTGIIASTGIAFLGQITSVLALHSRFRHVLLFIVFFPLSLPAIITGASYTRLVYKSHELLSGISMLTLESAYAFLYIAAGIILYDYLWEE